MLLISLLSLGACSGDEGECSAGFVKGEDGNCYAVSGGDDTAADTDTDTDTDTDADTDTDTDADPPGNQFSMEGSVTILNNNITADGSCNIAVWAASKIDETTGQPADPEDTPNAGANLDPCPTDDTQTPWTIPAIDIGDETQVYVNLFVDPDGRDNEDLPARSINFVGSPVTVTDGATLTGIDIELDMNGVGG